MSSFIKVPDKLSQEMWTFVKYILQKAVYCIYTLLH